MWEKFKFLVVVLFGLHTNSLKNLSLQTFSSITNFLNPLLKVGDSQCAVSKPYKSILFVKRQKGHRN